LPDQSGALYVGDPTLTKEVHSHGVKAATPEMISKEWLLSGQEVENQQ